MPRSEYYEYLMEYMRDWNGDVSTDDALDIDGLAVVVGLPIYGEVVA